LYQKVIPSRDVLANVEEYGDDPGAPGQGLLETAVAQPRARFGGEDLYPSLAERS
jgi:hypothetical protein